MKPISPFRILLFILSVFSLLLLASLFFPEKGIPLGEKYTLRFPSFAQFLNPPKKGEKKEAVSRILKDIDTSLTDGETPLPERRKHANRFGKMMGDPSEKEAAAQDENHPQYLEFGTQSPAILYPFFEKADALSQRKRIVRIIHYGDSQIEGDRMSGYIRQKLQAKFGGNGPGMIAGYNQYPTISFQQNVSSNFKRYTIFPYPVKEVLHRKFGSMGSFARFTGISGDSLPGNLPAQEGWIEISPHRQAFGNARQYNRVRMFYGNCKAPVLVQVFLNDELIHEEDLITDAAYHTLELQFEETPQKLRYVFTGTDSPDIYGFSLDGNYGIALDNVAMRGSSGDFVGISDHGLLRQMYADLEVDLFIMQFGGNSVPGLKTEAGASHYAGLLRAQLNHLKKLRPGAPIIVIGPSDMSTKEGGTFVTYPLLPLLIEKMKAEVFKAGAAYWDIYSAMGGENSMPEWVDKELASEDYVHFTPGGARYVAEMFYSAFLHEYQQYCKRSEPTTKKTTELQDTEAAKKHESEVKKGKAE